MCGLASTDKDDDWREGSILNTACMPPVFIDSDDQLREREAKWFMIRLGTEEPSLLHLKWELRDFYTVLY